LFSSHGYCLAYYYTTSKLNIPASFSLKSGKMLKKTLLSRKAVAFSYENLDLPANSLKVKEKRTVMVTILLNQEEVLVANPL
jgi:hypothetical protein